MRRGVSIAVLLVVLTSFMVPLLQGATPTLPACCRVGGQHHCTGIRGLDGFQAEPSKCPYRIAPAVTRSEVALAAIPWITSMFATTKYKFALQSPDPLLSAHSILQTRAPPAA